MSLSRCSRSVRENIAALHMAASSRRVPLHARVFAKLVSAYGLSPINLIPDFVPILGRIDDYLILVLGGRLAAKFVPEESMRYFRQEAAGRPLPRGGAGAPFVISMLWLMVGIAGLYWLATSSSGLQSMLAQLR